VTKKYSSMQELLSKLAPQTTTIAFRLGSFASARVASAYVSLPLSHARDGACPLQHDSGGMSHCYGPDATSAPWIA
jgi:hypothetical protein